MTGDEKTKLFRDVFATDSGEKVLEILKAELGYNSRCLLRETDRQQCYWAGRASVIQYILDTINIKKESKNGRRK